MEESKYRGSRLCRLLGNPVVYQLILLLESNGPLTPSKLAKFAGRSVQTVSGHLAKLRAADLVRYDSKGKEVRLKCPDSIVELANFARCWHILD